MRKIYSLICIIVLILVGCSNDSLHFKGESEHWEGEYSADITDGTREDVQYVFHFKDGKQIKKDLVINIDNCNSQSKLKEEKNNEAIITIPKA